MKHLFLLSTFFLLIAISSCKKCITCANRCYYCQYWVDTLCSTDFGNGGRAFDTIVAQKIANGETCIIITSTKKQEYCNTSTENNKVKTTLTQSGYTCN